MQVQMRIHALSMRLLFFSILFILGVPDTNGQFKEGLIIDKYSQAYPGWLSYSMGEGVGYKETKKSKAEWLGTDDVKAFSIEKDTFVAVTYRDLVTEIEVNRFAKVLVRGPKSLLCLTYYEQYQLGATAGGGVGQQRVLKEILFVVEKGDALPLTRYNFYDDMPKIIADHSGLRQRILSRKATFDMMEEIIQEYEAFHNRPYKMRISPGYLSKGKLNSKH